MSIATGTAIAVGATAAAGVAGSAIAANAQGNATDKAVNAENTSAANTLAFNRDVYNTTTANESPFLNLGTQAAGQLSAGLSDGSLTAAYPGGAFSFTPADFQKDPAYQFNLDQGLQAQQRTAAASGGLVSGAALKDAAGFASGLAANTYQQQYTNALAAYQQAYSQFENQQSNTFNRLSGVVGIGQAAASNTAAAGNAAAGTVASTDANTANALATLATGQGNATGAAALTGANAVSGASNQLQNYLAQQQQMSGSSYGTTMTPYRPNYPVDPATGL